MKIEYECISREDLEKERIEGRVMMFILCDMKDKCSRKGEYIRCGFDRYDRCPFYVAYVAQK